MGKYSYNEDEGLMFYMVERNVIYEKEIYFDLYGMHDGDAIMCMRYRYTGGRNDDG